MNLTNKQKAIVALIVANTIWGAASPIFKWSLQDIPLFALAYLRFFVASLILFPFAIKRNLKIAPKHFPHLVALAILGITVNITFFFLGLELAPSINAPIIASSGPIILILASILILKEHPPRKTIFGTLISLLGVFVIIGRPLLEDGFNFQALWGNLFFLIATIAAVGHTIVNKEIANKYSALVLTFYSFLLGSLTFLPFFIYETWQNGGLQPLDIRGLVGLIFGIFLSSTLAYSLFHWSMSRITASEVGVFTYIDPVIATIIAIPLLGEVITPFFILGSFFVFAGIFVAEGRIHYHPFHKLHGLR